MANGQWESSLKASPTTSPRFVGSPAGGLLSSLEKPLRSSLDRVEDGSLLLRDKPPNSCKFANTAVNVPRKPLWVGSEKEEEEGCA